MKILEKTGLSCIYNLEEFYKKDIKLRDGRDALLWVNKNDGHGILDDEYWESQDFYYEDYRKKFSAKLNNYTHPNKHSIVYKNINKRQFLQFKHILNEETKFLEIGSSFGGIINQVKKYNIKNFDAIEPNIEDFEYTKEKIKKCNIVNGLFEEYEFNEKYNLIVSFEVLEHVPNIEIFLRKLYLILDIGGFINFEVPNHNDALLRTYNIERYQSFYYHKSHIHYFTKQSLKKIFSYFGFEGEVSGFQMYPFYNQIFWLYNNAPQKNAIDALSYPINRNIDKEINDFFDETNKKYLDFVENKFISDCLVFRGYKK